ncbi:baculoviral IAP repeat-containing protein 2 [Elysia marginata]|uniref:Baculoviral IAP repeat-containing protein 2 n=1 Tax=Elysia marginata TaxID=1093978 RepID=A0AAV4HT44_9GAST|nr:baculoviral IAP repeat-containing protein 2 [Elysia marginata]
MQNGNIGYDVGPDEIRLPTTNQETMQQNAPTGMVPVQVISGFTEDENGGMEVEYEQLYVMEPPGGLFHEPLDYGPELARARNEAKPTTRQLYKERERLLTFQGRWSRDYPVQPRDLARDGLYYIGPGDRVKCVFCQQNLRGWEEGDVVEQEHKRIYPNCPFVLGRCNQMNVPYNSPETMQHSYGVKVRQEEGHAANGQSAEPMQDMAMRLKTLQHKQWPSTVPVDPRLIAEAGLFYIGVKDKTKCFKCHKIIQCWEKGDDPWREHAKLSPDCPYVLEKKGKEFVKAAALPVATGNGFSSAPQPASLGAALLPQSQELEASGIINQMSSLQIDEDMRSTAVQAFREYFEEVPVAHIRQLLERIRLEKGPTYKLSSKDLEPLTRN